MKNIYLSLFSALLLLSGCGKAAYISDAESMNIKGHVKQMTEFVLDAETVSDEQDSTEQKERTDYDVARVFDFDTHGRITNIRVIAKEDNYTQKYVYDKDSILQNIDCYKGTELVAIKKYSYNLKGQVSSIITVDTKTNKEEGSRNFSYNSIGKVEKEVVKNDKGETVIIIKNVYNHLGQLSQSTSFTNNTDKGSKRLITYNEKGYLSSTETVDELFGEKGIPFEYKYNSYDEKDNWTSRMGISMGMQVDFLERSYEYYE
ncbi:MAG: hypothetical protein PHD21_05155 [Flavobacteriales bacterium]|nr:hypothetical protein [Flavobacteriales bacterium]